MTTSPARLVAVLVAVGLVVALLVSRTSHRPAPGSAEPHRSVVSADTPAARLLRGWDTRRSAAYAAGSTRMLADLYVPGSTAGRSDVRLLRAYRARGFRVVGMRMQVLALRVVAKGHERLRLVVTDRLATATVQAHRRRVRLPTDTPSARTITLVRAPDGVWRVSDVEQVR